MSRNFVQELVVRVKAGYQFLGVNTAEEGRCIRDIRRAGWMMADGRKLGDAATVTSITAALEAAGEAPFSVTNAGVMTIRAEPLLRAYDHAVAAGDQPTGKTIKNVLDGLGYPVVTWDMIDGFGDKKLHGEPGEALQAVSSDNKLPTRALFVFKDLVQFLNAPDNPQWRRVLRNLYEDTRLVNDEIRRPVLLLQPDWVPHPDIAHCVSFIDFDLPGVAHLDREVSATEEALGGKGDSPTCPPELRQGLVYSLRGLTSSEAANALSLGVAAYKGFFPEMLVDIRSIKAQAMRSDETLEYVSEEKLASAEDIGGYENYLEYIAECRECYTKEAAEAGLKKPKGALLLGAPGTGKSVVAAATAKLLRLPLINFDFGAVFGGVVGQSESTMRRSLRRIKAQGACVVRIDEADKAFSGMQQTSGDSGVGQRVFGRLLSWMANENEEAFVIMTMNRLDGVPIEMLRSGRLDATFYTSLPAPAERRQILNIHLRRNGVPAGTFTDTQLTAVITKTEGFVGSELEQVAIKAGRIAWAKRKTIVPTLEELALAAVSVNPVSVVDKANIDKILQFCEGRATPVSKPTIDVSVSNKKGRGNIVVGHN